jgi:hypothetical protein
MGGRGSILDLGSGVGLPGGDLIDLGAERGEV